MINLSLRYEIIFMFRFDAMVSWLFQFKYVWRMIFDCVNEVVAKLFKLKKIKFLCCAVFKFSQLEICTVVIHWIFGFSS